MPKIYEQLDCMTCGVITNDNTLFHAMQCLRDGESFVSSCPSSAPMITKVCIYSIELNLVCQTDN